MPTCFLSQRQAISLSGADTIEFLQGLISNDARLLQKGEAIYAAMLTPQGKFLHDFFLIPWQGKIFIDVAKSRANDLIARLKLYRLRSKVEIISEDSLCVATSWGEEPDIFETNEYKIYHDPRLPELGFRIVGISEAIQAISKEIVPEQAYEKLRLGNCIAATRDMIVEKSLLLEFGFPELHGVDFSKGCYVGQEVTARSKFRGQVRKSLYHITSNNSALPIIGTKITAGEKEIGEIRTSLDNIGIAIINNEAYEAAKIENLAFYCAGKNVDLKLPNWANFSK